MSPTDETQTKNRNPETMYATANPTSAERAELIQWHTAQAAELDSYADSLAELDRDDDAAIWRTMAGQHRAKVNELTATDPETAELTHTVISALHRLADRIDAGYSDACADTCCTNENPSTDAERVVWALHCLALTLNASGLGEREGVARFTDYGFRNLHK